MKPILVSSGEPTGIGPDICLALATLDIPVVVAGDPKILHDRARLLGKSIDLIEFNPLSTPSFKKNSLVVLPIHHSQQVVPGVLSSQHSTYVMDMLSRSIDACLNNQFSALVTAPVHKGVINDAGFQFTGHTEFLAEKCHVDKVVMMLANDQMRVALATTHLPLAKVSENITCESLTKTLVILHHALKRDFNISEPRIKVAGLNPHAGEGGHLGTEEIEIINPVIETLRASGMDIRGSYSADTLFKNNDDCDAYLAMFHDQGLPVLKYSGFGKSVNITLGLPMIRTSVDHGTAIELAGTGSADSGSLIYAVEAAWNLVKVKE